MSSSGLTKQLTVFPFLISGLLWKIGDAGHRSIHVFLICQSVRVINPCVSHLASRLTCLAGGVQRSCLCQTDVFDSLISVVMFPPTSFWGKTLWFGTPIAFSASSVLFQMLPFAYWKYKSMSSFGLTKQLTVFPFLISGVPECFLSHDERFYHLRYIPWWFGTPIAFWAKLCTVSDASFPYWTSLSEQVVYHVFFWPNKTAYCISFFDFRAPLKNWRCGAPIPVPLAC